MSLAILMILVGVAPPLLPVPQPYQYTQAELAILPTDVLPPQPTWYMKTRANRIQPAGDVFREGHPVYQVPTRRLEQPLREYVEIWTTRINRQPMVRAIVKYSDTDPVTGRPTMQETFGYRFALDENSNVQPIISWYQTAILTTPGVVASAVPHGWRFEFEDVPMSRYNDYPIRRMSLAVRFENGREIERVSHTYPNPRLPRSVEEVVMDAANGAGTRGNPYLYGESYAASGNSTSGAVETWVMIPPPSTLDAGIDPSDRPFAELAGRQTAPYGYD